MSLPAKTSALYPSADKSPSRDARCEDCGEGEESFYLCRACSAAASKRGLVAAAPAKPATPIPGLPVVGPEAALIAKLSRKLDAYHDAVTQAIDFLSGIQLPGSPKTSIKARDIIRLLMEADGRKSRATK